MSFSLNDNAKYNLAKSFTELAIQNGLIVQCEDAAETAEQTTIFFDTVVNTLCSHGSQKQ